MGAATTVADVDALTLAVSQGDLSGQDDDDLKNN